MDNMTLREIKKKLSEMYPEHTLVKKKQTFSLWNKMEWI